MVYNPHMRKRTISKIYFPVFFGLFILFSGFIVVREQIFDVVTQWRSQQEKIFAQQEQQRVLEEVSAKENAAKILEQTDLVALNLVTIDGSSQNPFSTTNIKNSYVNGDLFLRVNFQLYDQIGYKKKEVKYTKTIQGTTNFCYISDFGGRRTFPLAMRLTEAPLIPGFLVYGNSVGLDYVDSSGTLQSASMNPDDVATEPGNFFINVYDKTDPLYAAARTAALYGISPKQSSPDENIGGGANSVSSRLYIASKNSPNTYLPQYSLRTDGAPSFKDQLLENKWNDRTISVYQGSAFALKFNNYFIADPARPQQSLKTTKFWAIGKAGNVLAFDDPQSTARYVISPELQTVTQYASPPSPDNKILNSTLKRIEMTTKDIDEDSKEIIDFIMRGMVYKYADKSKNYRTSYSPLQRDQTICDYTGTNSAYGGPGCPVVSATAWCGTRLYMNYEIDPGVGVLYTTTDSTTDAPNKDAKVNSTQRAMSVNWGLEFGSPMIQSIFEKASVVDLIKVNAFPPGSLSATCANNLSGVTQTNLTEKEHKILGQYYASNSGKPSQARSEAGNIIMIDTLNDTSFRGKVVIDDSLASDVTATAGTLTLNETGKRFPLIAVYPIQQLYKSAVYDAPDGELNNQVTTVVDKVLSEYGIVPAVGGTDYEFDCTGPGDLHLNFKGDFAFAP